MAIRHQLTIEDLINASIEYLEGKKLDNSNIKEEDIRNCVVKNKLDYSKLYRVLKQKSRLGLLSVIDLTLPKSFVTDIALF